MWSRRFRLRLFSVLTIRKAQIEDLDLVAPLFDAYRQFYRQPPDPQLARAFLTDRFRNNESIIFIALNDSGAALGFTQPSFSSASARRIYILNDLFVAPEARRQNVGRKLLQAAADFGNKAGAVRLTLSTALDNSTAQSLYESAGWLRNTEFCTYTLPL